MTNFRTFLQVGLLWLTCFLVPLAAAAQTDGDQTRLTEARDLAQTVASGELGEYYDAWQRTADRAERVLDARRASNGALEALRVELTEYRQQFLDAGNQNADRLKTLRAQIDALGPAPDDSGSEPENIAKLRQELQSQLATLSAPQVLADLGYSRAQGLITEIDKLIRERATRTPVSYTHLTLPTILRV